MKRTTWQIAALYVLLIVAAFGARQLIAQVGLGTLPANPRSPLQNQQPTLNCAICEYLDAGCEKRTACSKDDPECGYSGKVPWCDITKSKVACQKWLDDQKKKGLEVHGPFPYEIKPKPGTEKDNWRKNCKEHKLFPDDAGTIMSLPRCHVSGAPQKDMKCKPGDKLKCLPRNFDDPKDFGTTTELCCSFDGKTGTYERGDSCTCKFPNSPSCATDGITKLPALKCIIKGANGKPIEATESCCWATKDHKKARIIKGNCDADGEIPGAIPKPPPSQTPKPPKTMK